MKQTLSGLKITIIKFLVIKGNLVGRRKSHLCLTQEIGSDYCGASVCWSLGPLLGSRHTTQPSSEPSWASQGGSGGLCPWGQGESLWQSPHNSGPEGINCLSQAPPGPVTFTFPGTLQVEREDEEQAKINGVQEEGFCEGKSEFSTEKRKDGESEGWALFCHLTGRLCLILQACPPLTDEQAQVRDRTHRPVCASRHSRLSTQTELQSFSNSFLFTCSGLLLRLADTDMADLPVSLPVCPVRVTRLTHARYCH